MGEYTCIFYETVDGRKPAEEFREENNTYPWLCEEDTESPAKGNRDCSTKKKRLFNQN